MQQLFHVLGVEPWQPHYFVVAEDIQHATQLVYQAKPDAIIGYVEVHPFNTVIVIE